METKGGPATEKRIEYRDRRDGKECGDPNKSKLSDTVTYIAAESSFHDAPFASKLTSLALFRIRRNHPCNVTLASRRISKPSDHLKLGAAPISNTYLWIGAKNFPRPGCLTDGSSP